MKNDKAAEEAQATPVAEPADYQARAAAEFAAQLGARRRAAGAPVRTLFVSNELVDRPPLARLLSSGTTGGGGRGGQLRVKLYLSLLWVCAKAPYHSQRPARAWSALLGLPDPEKRGVRRVQETFRELAERGFVQIDDRGSGLPSTIILRSERGDGSPYMPASEAYSTLQRRDDVDPEVLKLHRYFRIPSTLWTAGHIARLQGPSLAMLLALMSEQRGQAADTGVWFSPSRARERFGFAASTRSEGLHQLQTLGLVRTVTRTVSESGAYIDFARRRNVHEVIGLKPASSPAFSLPPAADDVFAGLKLDRRAKTKP